MLPPVPRLFTSFYSGALLFHLLLIAAASTLDSLLFVAAVVFPVVACAALYLYCCRAQIPDLGFKELACAQSVLPQQPAGFLFSSQNGVPPLLLRQNLGIHRSVLQLSSIISLRPSRAAHTTHAPRCMYATASLTSKPLEANGTELFDRHKLIRNTV